jgi:hypothetical protein
MLRPRTDPTARSRERRSTAGDLATHFAIRRNALCTSARARARDRASALCSTAQAHLCAADTEAISSSSAVCRSTLSSTVRTSSADDRCRGHSEVDRCRRVRISRFKSIRASGTGFVRRCMVSVRRSSGWLLPTGISTRKHARWDRLEEPGSYFPTGACGIVADASFFGSQRPRFMTLSTRRHRAMPGAPALRCDRLCACCRCARSSEWTCRDGLPSLELARC